jgi:predicted O-methyltransferase YrrM
MSFESINGVIDRTTTDGWSGYPNEFLEFLYSRVVEKNPSTILEFGTGWGYTTIALAQGVRDSENVNGVVYTYDHFVDDYDGTWTNNQTAVNDNLIQFGVQDYVKTHSMNIFKWFDFCRPSQQR